MEMKKRAKFPEHKIKTIYNGVAFPELIPPLNAEITKNKLGICKGEKVVGIVANMRSDKGYEYFIRAAHLIRKEIPNTKFIIIGEEQADIRKMMETQIAEYDLGKNVLFLGFQENVSEFLNIMDLYVLSSISEGLSIATIEAMAYGIPVVVTRSGGPEEIVEDGKTGYLVPIRDEKNIARKSILILTNRELAKSISERAKSDVRERFKIETMIKQYEDIYHECLD
jgi:glycosyltransferase involved in cell wall biosynthesis